MVREQQGTANRPLHFPKADQFLSHIRVHGYCPGAPDLIVFRSPPDGGAVPRAAHPTFTA
jgi:hypothetical protein